MNELNDPKFRGLNSSVMGFLVVLNISNRYGIPPCPGEHDWIRRARFIGILIFIVFPALAFAHDSTKAVEVEIGDRERYQELTDQVAPVFTLRDVDGNSISLAE